MSEPIVFKYGSQDIRVVYSAEHYEWTGAIEPEDSKPVSVSFHTDYGAVRNEQIEIIQNGLSFVHSGGVLNFLDEVFACFELYKTKSHEIGNPWAEDFEQITSTRDIVDHIEDIMVYSNDGLGTGLACQVVLYCTWISYGGVNLHIDDGGQVFNVDFDTD